MDLVKLLGEYYALKIGIAVILILFVLGIAFTKYLRGDSKNEK